MRHLTVGVFQDETLGHELGKKGTTSDIAMYNRKMDDLILSFMSAVEDKLAPKSQIISTLDAAIVVFNEITRELGETIVMLDMIGVKHGIGIMTNYADRDRIASITKDTSLKSFTVDQKDPGKLLQTLAGINPTRNISSAPVVEIDHSFSVKGVGEVVLGFVKRGVVKKYDKLQLLPAKKEVIVRSIQIQDEDYEQAEAGTRVGLAIKDATVDEMGRGSVLTTSPEIKSDTRMDIAFKNSPFYSETIKDGAFHVTVGMQTVPVNITMKDQETVSLESPKSVVYESGQTAILLDLNAKKNRIMGKGSLK
jgi:selenocysteine-specific translation elongation factor